MTQYGNKAKQTMTLGIAAALLAGGSRACGEVVEIQARPECDEPLLDNNVTGVPRKKKGKRKRRHRGIGW